MDSPAFIKVARRELNIAAVNPSVRNLLLIIPAVVFVLLAFIYIEGAISEIPVAVLDEDNTELSRTIISFLDATEQMNVTYYLSSEDDLKTFFLDHKEHAIFRIPKNTELDVITGKGANIQTYTNSSNIIFGNILLREAYIVLGTVSAGATLERLISAGLTEDRAMDLALPVIVNYKPLYNPVYNYLYYLVPGLLTVLLQMIIFFISTRAINSEITSGTYDELVLMAKGNPMNIITGKSIIYLFFGLALSSFIILIFVAFGIPFQDRIWELVILFSVFLLANIMIGLMLSSTIDDEILSLDIAFFYNSPAFVFSGFTFPMIGMPFFDTLYAQFIPYTHFLYAFFKVYQIGTDISFIWSELTALGIFIITGFVTAGLALKLKSTVKSKSLVLVNE
jgi:ABC-2 type transport system permease protein